MAVLAIGIAQADEPKPPTPVVPIASIVAPSTQPLVLFSDGAVSKSGLTWSVVAPKGTPFKVYNDPVAGSVLVIPAPVPGTTYKFAQVATGDAPPFAFDFADVTVPAKVDCPPVNPGPVVPTPTPTPVPNPAPAPVPVNPPVVGNFYAVLVWDHNQAEPRTDQLRVSALVKQLKAIGCEWQVETTQQAAENGRTTQLAGATIPAVLFIARTGALLGRLPTTATTTPADVVAKAEALKAGGN